MNVPDAYHFWFVLTKDALYITTSRRNDMAKTADVIQIDSLDIQTESGANYKGGVED